MGEAAGVQRDHAGLDVVAAEEVAPVVEQHFVVVVVVVEERHLERPRIGLHRPRREGADHEAVGDEGGVGRRRQVVAVAHQRADVAPVEPHHGVVAVPAHRIQRVERVGDGADLVASLDTDLPSALVLLGLEGVVETRVVEHRRIEDRLWAEQALVRQLVGAVGVLDQQEVAGRARFDAPGGTARDHQIVAVAVFQVAEVAIEVPRPVVDEQQLVAVAVAHQVAHGAVGLPHAQLDVGVVQGQRRFQRAVALAGNLVEVEGVRAQRPFPINPAGGRVLVVQVGHRAEEALAAHFPLVGAFGEIAVGLARVLALAQGEADPFAAHGQAPCRVAQGLPGRAHHVTRYCRCAQRTLRTVLIIRRP